MMQTVVYLAPGDYHRFHSPARWVVTHRTHIWGDLLSVAPPFLSRITGLFHINERYFVKCVGPVGVFFVVTQLGGRPHDSQPYHLTSIRQYNHRTEFN